jgi:hypothetical protein
MASDAETCFLPACFSRDLISQTFHYPTINLRGASLNRGILEIMKIPKIELLIPSMVYTENRK